MTYYRVHLGYEKSFGIDETELEKALYLQATKRSAVIGGRGVNGTYISLIEPDFARAMGWNEGYERLSPEDHAEIRRAGIVEPHRLFLEAATEKVKLAVKSNNPAMLTGTADLKQLNG